MDPSFWHERWVDGRIGFHRPDVNPQLAGWWPSLGLAPGSRVLVPLCGKSRDLAWLASQGHDVVGVELSGIACAAFFEESGLTPAVHTRQDHVVWSVPGVALWQGDFFQFEDGLFDAVFDRAATIALPPRLRAPYAAQLARMVRPGGRGLLVSLDYPQHEKDGPPFAVPADEVERLYAPAFALEALPLVPDAAPELPVSRVNEHLWRLTRAG